MHTTLLLSGLSNRLPLGRFLSVAAGATLLIFVNSATATADLTDLPDFDDATDLSETTSEAGPLNGAEAYAAVLARNNDPAARGPDGRALNFSGRCKASVIDFLQVAGVPADEISAILFRGNPKDIGNYWVKHRDNLPPGWRLVHLGGGESRDFSHGGIIFYRCPKEARGHVAIQMGDPALLFDNHTRALGGRNRRQQARGQTRAAAQPSPRDATHDDRICGRGAFAQIVYEGWR